MPIRTYASGNPAVPVSRTNPSMLRCISRIRRTRSNAPAETSGTKVSKNTSAESLCKSTAIPLYHSMPYIIPANYQFTLLITSSGRSLVEIDVRLLTSGIIIELVVAFLPRSVLQANAYAHLLAASCRIRNFESRWRLGIPRAPGPNLMGSNVSSTHTVI